MTKPIERSDEYYKERIRNLNWKWLLENYNTLSATEKIRVSKAAEETKKSTDAKSERHRAIMDCILKVIHE